VRGLTVTYGGLRANDAVDIEVASGQVVGLIGPNGAGKSTFVDAVCGFVSYSGTVLLGGRALDGLAPHRRRRLGLARTWQSVELFTDLSVRANVDVADAAVSTGALLLDLVQPHRRRDAQRVDAALAAVGLDGLRDSRPGELSTGERKRLGVARALAGNPRVVLLDEPASGLDRDERQLLRDLLRRLAAAGLAVLLIEHDVDLVLATCDHVVVLDFGVVIAAGTPDEVRRDERVAAAYLGSRSTAAGTAR